MKKRNLYIIIAIVLIAGGFAAYKLMSGKESKINIETDTVKRATISNTVTATGTLEATTTVEVGTQVSGRIEKLYADYNSQVKKGQLLARLDTESLESTLESSKANLDQAQAEVDYQKATYERYKKLIDKKLIAQADFDQVECNYKTAVASLSQSKATYKTNKTNLGYAYIYSPIDGIVLERDVEEGETVAASYETPTLFTIANDLTQMEIEADVDEADIGQVKVGQRVEFNVDAFPYKTFEGTVKSIYLSGTEDESVITYTVIITAPNPDKLLMPQMTANVTFYVTEKKDILVVPNLALEFSPDPATMALFKELHPEVQLEMPKGESEKQVWVKTDNKIYPTTVEVGETDEINYELLSDGLKEGTALITSMEATKASKGAEHEAARSPFMPTPPGAKKNKK